MDVNTAEYAAIRQDRSRLSPGAFDHRGRHKPITTSEDLFKNFGLAPERSDDEIVADDNGGDDVTALPGETWLVVLDGVAAERSASWPSARARSARHDGSTPGTWHGRGQARRRGGALLSDLCASVHRDRRRRRGRLGDPR